MKKTYVTWSDVEHQTQEILRQLQQQQWRPDYVVGLTRGGLVPANLISQYLECPMETLKVSLRDDNGQPESNLWMAEDAFGYRDHDPMASGDGRKNILIVDDINDTGATLNYIKQDWQSSCFPKDPRWKEIWGNNVRLACLYDNESSKSKLDVTYSAVTINKSADPCWIVFPWEDAFGYRDHDPMASGDGRKNILIVDDINDTGATLNYIKQDWQSSCFPKDPRWKEIWGNNVRLACLYDNESSKSKLDVTYSAVTINKSADPCWIVFPWEDWWTR